MEGFHKRNLIFEDSFLHVVGENFHKILMDSTVIFGQEERKK